MRILKNMLLNTYWGVLLDGIWNSYGHSSMVLTYKSIYINKYKGKTKAYFCLLNSFQPSKMKEWNAEFAQQHLRSLQEYFK